ncbi:DUF2171 domain-containing protein [Desertibaculum subflavum]|uniref:DUF2171 domain-containing protein n=1 Tax=Desertibaculum subflavum TaxID=2268458 RepID=UPI000E662C62
MSVQANNIREHMEVLGSDRQRVGTVDHVEGNRLKLTKNDAPDGQHHYIDLASCDRVEGDKVVLNQTCEQARKSWH